SHAESNVEPGDSLSLAGASLNATELGWINHVRDSVVPRLPGGARAAATVMWWSLMEGVLDVKPNPWRHNLCTINGRDQQSGDLGAQCGSTWQIGMAGIQYPNVRGTDVEAAARQLYPGEALTTILARIAKDAQVDATTATTIT